MYHFFVSYAPTLNLETLIFVLTSISGGSSTLPSSSYDRLSNFRRAIMYNDPDNAGGQKVRSLSSCTPNPLFDLGAQIPFTRKIAQGAILQARQEGPLVDLQLKRHKAGESGEYVSQESQLDATAICGKFPAHYYREIGVCESCFLVRSLAKETLI